MGNTCCSHKDANVISGELQRKAESESTKKKFEVPNKLTIKMNNACIYRKKTVPLQPVSV